MLFILLRLLRSSIGPTTLHCSSAACRHLLDECRPSLGYLSNGLERDCDFQTDLSKNMVCLEIAFSLETLETIVMGTIWVFQVGTMPICQRSRARMRFPNGPFDPQRGSQEPPRRTQGAPQGYIGPCFGPFGAQISFFVHACVYVHVCFVSRGASLSARVCARARAHL